MNHTKYSCEKGKQKPSSVIALFLSQVSISGYGQSGPNSLKPCYDVVAQGEGGIMSITGERGTAKSPRRLSERSDRSMTIYAWLVVVPHYRF